MQEVTFLQRYVAGEHEQVWAELVALGDAVREEPLYADAQAVARETMRRVLQNVLLLIRRLREVGYRFGYSWCTPDGVAFLRRELCPPLAFTEPDPDVRSQLDHLEAQVGPMPLALRAWYEQIGSVNSVGMYPVDDPTDPEGFAHWQQVKALGGPVSVQEYAAMQAARPCRHDLDPLWVYPLTYARDFLEGSTMSELAVAPDECFKLGQPGGGYYTLTLPNASADALVDYEWHDTTFVNYLRICFKWGGFPGLECKRRRPEKELAFLTEGLLPI